MKEKKNRLDRRGFLKTVGAAGIGSVLVGGGCAQKGAEAPAIQPSQADYAKVPRRVLGRTGVEIPCVGLGGVFNLIENQTILGATLEYGIDYWDTATNYSNTKSQQGIGRYLAAHPGLREKIFLVSKPIDLEDEIPNVAQFEEDLHTSLKRMNTDYVDLYCGLHGMWDAAQLTDEVRDWAASAKKRGLIRYFGFSTHANMAACLAAAAKCDWVDVILTMYNFQWAEDEEMQKALDACYNAGIGLIAIKTQRKASLEPLDSFSEDEHKLVTHFTERGFTPGQAKLKFVLDDKRFAAAAVGMNELDVLKQNVAAALDKTQLTEKDRSVLHEYARATCSGYCAGCADICRAAVPDVPYINHIMRYLMYYNSYGHEERAKRLFRRIPKSVRRRLLKVDYSLAEARCPNRLPIRRAVEEAVTKLA